MSGGRADKRSRRKADRQIAAPPSARVMSQDGTLAAALGSHAEWLQSKGLSGQCADFRDADFSDADVSEATFRDADLHGANLSEARGLRISELAGADLSGAKLPEDIDWTDRLKALQEDSNTCQKLLLLVLIGCAYSALTAASTTDARLLTNASTSRLPIIDTEIAIVGFYRVAPVLLFGAYLHLHLCLQRLWETIALLPAVFPDDVAIDRKIPVWLLAAIVPFYFRNLRSRRQQLSRLQLAFAIITAWWTVPFVLAFLWIRCLPRHDWVLTGPHVVEFAMSVAAALTFFNLARKTLAAHSAPLAAPKGLIRGFAVGAAFLACSLFAALVSYGAIHCITNVNVPIEGGRSSLESISSGTTECLRGSDEARSGVSQLESWLKKPRILVPDFLDIIGFRAFARLSDQEVSIRLPGWKVDDTSAVRPASLARRDLRYVSAGNAFLAKADLYGACLLSGYLLNADLREAVLDEADLRQADLTGAILIKAKLGSAKLRGANLKGADLTGSDLTGADLRGAILEDAKLIDAGLLGADFTGADLLSADFTGAAFQGAQFIDVQKASCSLLERASAGGAEVWYRQCNPD